MVSCSTTSIIGNPVGPALYLDAAGPNVGHGDPRVATATTIYGHAAAIENSSHSCCCHLPQPLIFPKKILPPMDTLLAIVSFTSMSESLDTPRVVPPSSNYPSIIVSHIAPSQSLAQGAMTGKRAKARAFAIFIQVIIGSSEERSTDEAIR